MTSTNHKPTPAALIKMLNAAEKQYAPYHRLVRETRAYYKDAVSNGLSSGRYNIFWSSIETLKPFLYFKQPHPYIERTSKAANLVENTACRILEKALDWNLGQFDFDSVIKYARNDFLISGCGIVWEQYQPEFIEIKNPDAKNGVLPIKHNEQVVSRYVDPEYFLADCDKVGIWEDINWVARKTYMSRAALAQNFGKEFDNALAAENDVCVYEVWYKPTKTVYWVSREYPHKFLKELEDPLRLKGFFPCPKPIFATQTNDSVVPTPDYCLIKEMLSELNGITSRMKMVMQALKVSGAYDKSFPELYHILNKDVTLVAVSDFQKLKDCGGIRGIIDFAPIEQYVQALEQLSVRREDIIKRIFDVTGVSDIMRGNANSAETATAVRQKTNFGTLRNQDRQNDMQRFIADLYRIKAEIICEQFSEKALLRFLPEGENPLIAKQAVALLKTEKLRGMTLRVESDAVFDKEAEQQNALNGVKTVHEMIKEAFGLVSQQPLLLPLYRVMIEAVIASMPRARMFENVLEQAFDSISKELSKPDDKSGQAQALQNSLLAGQAQAAQEKNLLKRKELEIKEFAEKEKARINRAELRLKEERQL